MMPSDKLRNPFQPVLAAVGVLFTLSACVYGVMSVDRLDASRGGHAAASGHWLLEQMDRHGASLLLVDLALLALLALAYVGTDRYWKRSPRGGDD